MIEKLQQAGLFDRRSCRALGQRRSAKNALSAGREAEWARIASDIFSA
jgi:hypothetical protein